MGRRKISLDDYKDLVIALYQDGKSWRTIRAILHDEYGCDTSRHTIRKRCMAWDVEIRAQTKINDSLQDRIKELWADPEARPKDDHEMYQKLKADGFQVTLSAVCKLRKGLKLYRRWDEKWGRVRPDSELRGRKRHQQKYSYADFLAAQTSPATRASETCDGQDDQDESGDQDSQRQSDDEEDVAAEGLQAIAAATQGDRDGQSEQDNHARDVNEPRTTSATFQLDISTPYSDESEDGDEEIAETELDADYSDGGHPDNDNLEMAEDEADEGNDDGNSTPDGDSAEVKTPSERPSQQTHQFQTTPTEWYTNTHPGPTLADFPSPKLPKRHALPKKTKQPVMGLEGAQSPSTVLYSERERGKDAKIVALQQRIQLLEQHCIANEIALPGQKLHRSVAAAIAKRKYGKPPRQRRKVPTAASGRAGTVSAGQTQNTGLTQPARGHEATANQTRNSNSIIPPPFTSESPTQPYTSEAYASQMLHTSTIPQPYIPQAPAGQPHNASSFFLQRGFEATAGQINDHY